MRIALFARHHAAAKQQQQDQLLQPAAHDLHSLHAHHYLHRPSWGQGKAGGGAAAAAAGGRAADLRNGGAAAAAAAVPPPGHPLTHASALSAYEAVLACLIVLHAFAFCLLGYKLWRWSVEETTTAGGGKAAARRSGGGSAGGGAARTPMPPPPLARFPSGAGHYSGPLRRGGSIQSVRDALRSYVKVNMGKH